MTKLSSSFSMVNPRAHFGIDVELWLVHTLTWSNKKLGQFMHEFSEAVCSNDRAKVARMKPVWIGRVYWGEPKRAYISRRLRAAVFARDHHACIACGAVSNLSLDHAVPVKSGGPDTFDNLQVMCRPCNRLKWSR